MSDSATSAFGLIEGVDLESAGSHLVMTATLVHMKSRHLLPPDPEDAAGLIQEEELPIAAVRAVRSCAAPRSSFRSARRRWTGLHRSPIAVAEFAGEQGIDADLYALANAFQAIRRLGTQQEVRRITREKVSLMERVTWLVDTLNQRRRLSFKSLFAGLDDRLAAS